MTSNTFAERTTARLRAILGAQRITITDFAKQLGVNRTYVSTRLNDNVALSTSDLQLFSTALGYSPEEIISENFRLHEPSVTPAER